MHAFQRGLTMAALGATALGAAAQTPPPAPCGALPDQRHLLWHEMEFYGFLHFTTNTFTDKEWGYGDESPEIFNPTDFDADQIVGVAADAGMTGLILTCKHHDGFCLWPSEFTEHDVAASPWKDGRGDVVREIADACARRGLRFGVYLSPWDRNHPEYGRPAYIEYFRNQLRELLTNYGPVFEVWWDGANGGDGFYGGARETRTIDRSTYYDWDSTVRIVRDLQPDAVIFSDAGDVRWVGNERGVAGDPCWATYTARPAEGETRAVPGTTRYQDGEHGTRNGERWAPAECDVSIRPGWFYHESQDGQVKTPEQLVDLYYASVGRGASFLLNLPPDRRGRIPDPDIASLRGMRGALDTTFARNLAGEALASASNTRAGDGSYAPALTLDNNRGTYWSTDDAVTTPELVLRWAHPVSFNVVSLREFLPLGQRVTSWALDEWQDGAWREFASGEGVGARRLWRGGSYLTTTGLRLRITDAPVCPAISEIGVHAEPPRVEIMGAGEAFLGSALVSLRASLPGARIRYTLDGSAPTTGSMLYEEPLELTASVTLRAAAETGSGMSPFAESRSFTAYTRDSLRQAIALLRAPHPGLAWSAFEGGWQTLDQLAGREPVATGVAPGFDLERRPRDEHFALVFHGYLHVSADGLYEFSTASDDGSRLYLHDQLVVENDGLHGLVTKAGVVGLRAGFHPFRVEYFNGAGQSGLEVRWRPPGQTWGAIPQASLFGG
jgi:alpha-L-fucosidase